MKLTLLTLALASATSSAFVPPHKLARMHALKSTVSPSSVVVGTEKTTIGFNEDKFLADMDQALNELKPTKKKKKKLFRVPMDPIPADPMYVTQARVRIAALADRADERIEHFAWESKELKNKSVFDSFKSTYVAPPTVRYVKADALPHLQLEQWPKMDTVSVEEVLRMRIKAKEYMEMVKTIGKRTNGMGNTAVRVESVSSTTTSTNGGGGWIAGLALVLAGASVVEHAAVTDFVGNMNFDLDLSDLHLNMDLTAIQERVAATMASSQETLAQAATQLESSAATLQSEVVSSVSSWKDTALSMQSGQTLASQDFVSSAPSVVASAGDDLKAMLMEYNK